MELSDFDERYRRLLQHAIAAFLEVPPKVVRIENVEEGSVKVTVALHHDLADRLVASYRKKDPELLAYFAVMPVSDLHCLANKRLVNFLSKTLGIPAELINGGGGGPEIDLDFGAALKLVHQIEDHFDIDLRYRKLKSIDDVLALGHQIERKAEKEFKHFSAETLGRLDGMAEEELQQLFGVEDREPETP